MYGDRARHSASTSRPRAAHRRGAVADLVEQLDALLAGTAVHVAQRVDAVGHGAVEADPTVAVIRAIAIDGPAGRGRRRPPAPPPAAAPGRGGGVAAHHQPDHLGQRGGADQVLHRPAAQFDDAGLDPRHGGRPPVGHLARRVGPLTGSPAHQVAAFHRWSSCSRSSLCSPNRGRGLRMQRFPVDQHTVAAQAQAAVAVAGERDSRSTGARQLLELDHLRHGQDAAAGTPTWFSSCSQPAPGAVAAPR
jgi:hypothetical protein